MTTYAPAPRSQSAGATRLARDSGRATAAYRVAEVCLFLASVALYFGVRGLTEGRPAKAHHNAALVLAAERALSLDHERFLQQSVVGSAAATRLANWVYIFGHWPVIAVVLSWLLIRHPVVFRHARNTIFASGLIGMVVFAVFPVAPPRLSVAGLVDTVTEQSDAYRVLQPVAFTNQYAAMPSLHVGWDLVIGLALYAAACHRWQRILGIALPLAMASAVLLTANHYLLDVVAGAVLTSAVWAATGDPGGRLRPLCRQALLRSRPAAVRTPGARW
ncbi:MAG TPA: phosphatase PAP2 family protein [Mycobacteriales bacterium]